MTLLRSVRRATRGSFAVGTLVVLGCLAGCSAADGSDESSQSESATTKASKPAGKAEAPKGELDADEEEEVLRGILTEAVEKYEAKYGERLGWGWLGNVTGQGDKCNVVSDQLSPIVDNLIYANMRLRKARFVHHDLVTIVAAGMLCEALSGHVYFALHRYDAATKKLGDRVVTFDPWRSTSGFFETDPNTRPDEPIAWGVPSYPVPKDEPKP